MLENMTTNQRLLLATALSFLFFLFYSTVVPQPQPQNQNIEKTNQVQTEPKKIEPMTAPKIENEKISAPTVPVTNVKQVQKQIVENKDLLVKITFNNAILTIDTLGRISSKTLLEDKFKDSDGNLAQLIPDGSPKPLEMRFKNNKLNQEAFKVNYTSSANELTINNKPKTIVLTQKLTDLTITKKLTFFPNGKYSVEIQLSKPVQYYISNGIRPKVDKKAWVVQGEMVKVGQTLNIIKDGDADTTSVFRGVNFISAFDRYYASIFYNIDKDLNVIVEPYSDKKDPVAYIEASDNIKFDAFLGQKEHKLLASLNPDLVDAIEFGIMTILAKPMFLALKWIHDYIGNWGWAIVFLTIILKLALFSLQHKSIKSMYYMKKLAPQIKELQRKYKDNPMMLQKKMMELYQETGVNPLSGCLPMLLQLPFFFAFYRMLLNSVELQGAEWIFWIDNLAQHDPYFVLPILLGVMMYVQQKLYPQQGPTTDQMQQKIMSFLPVIFTFVFLTFPAGLTLYWFVGNLFSLVQQHLFNLKMAKVEEQEKLNNLKK